MSTAWSTEMRGLSRWDGGQVTAERSLTVGENRPLRAGDLRVRAASLLVDRDHVVHELELPALETGREPQPRGGIALAHRVFVMVVDVELGHDTVSDVLQDRRFAPERGVDSRSGNV